ncbi:MAG: 50S ribosomal protein L29 [Candidatus Pacebacteria bacterium]|nr:50S ribosomal protein L29 [Candidatus Paceibacterota bacterium]
MKHKSPMELERIAGESTERLRALRFDLAAGKVKNVAELREVRKRIARAKTFIKEQMTSSQ